MLDLWREAAEGRLRRLLVHESADLRPTALPGLRDHLHQLRPAVDAVPCTILLGPVPSRCVAAGAWILVSRLPRSCLICSEPALPGSSRCARHGGRKRDPRTTTARGYGGDHQQFRLKVLARAGADRHGLGGRCERCGQPGVPGNPLEAGHVLARALGGENVLANYAALCRRCNRRETGALRKAKRLRGDGHS
jgi:5-methylcytosine-specific restriction endonuclease McrA